MHPIVKWAFSNNLGNLTGKCLFLKIWGSLGLVTAAHCVKSCALTLACPGAAGGGPFPGTVRPHASPPLGLLSGCPAIHMRDWEENEAWAIFILSLD